MIKKIFTKFVSFVLVFSLINGFTIVQRAEAVTTVPKVINYLSRLNDAAGNPIKIETDHDNDGNIDQITYRTYEKV